MLKRGYQGTFHKFSEKHLDRYVGSSPAATTSGRGTRWT